MKHSKKICLLCVTCEATEGICLNSSVHKTTVSSCEGCWKFNKKNISGVSFISGSGLVHRLRWGTRTDCQSCPMISQQSPHRKVIPLTSLNQEKIHCYTIWDRRAWPRGCSQLANVTTMQETCRLLMSRELLIRSLYELLQCFLLSLQQQLCAVSQRGMFVLRVYLSDLLPRSLVRLQLIQDPLCILQHHVHLVPHLSLRVCGLGVCDGRQEQEQQQQQQGQWGKSDWFLIHIHTGWMYSKQQL